MNLLCITSSRAGKPWIALLLIGFLIQANPGVSNGRAWWPWLNDGPPSWSETMMTEHVPSPGCSKATVPVEKWVSIPCSAVPVQGWYTPRRTDKGAAAGAREVAAFVQPKGGRPGTIRRVEGAFSDAKVAGEVNATRDGKITPGAGVFSLQLNTNTFATPMCKGSANPDCRGWEQFILSNDPGSAAGQLFIQYWLLHFGSPCPGMWTPSGSDCVFTTQAVEVKLLTLKQLNNVILSAKVEDNGTDTVVLNQPGSELFAFNSDSRLELAPNWTTAQFNVFGDKAGRQAMFSPGSWLMGDVRVDAESDGDVVPIVVSLSGETNSLTQLTPGCRRAGIPGVSFKESNVAGDGYICPDDQCGLHRQEVAYDQKALATAQAALATPACSGEELQSVCQQELNIALRILHTEESATKEICRKKTP